MISNEKVENIAIKLGFDLVGFARVEELDYEIKQLNEWLSNGYQGGMKYMEENVGKRKNVKNLLDGAKSVISLGMNYYTNHHHEDKDGYGKISRYAWGKDYHFVIWEKLEEFILILNELDPKVKAVSYVDTGPVMDKAWAQKAGIGWMGKHSNIINREMGSWFFIANIITNIDLTPSNIITDHCGTCTACIDACPTDAIVKDYIVDSNKCISYLTIENKNEIPDVYADKFDNWLLGCDICQDVCPWNEKFSSETQNEDFQPNNAGKEMPLNSFENLSNRTFMKKYAFSPILRPRLKGMKRNAAFLKK